MRLTGSQREKLSQVRAILGCTEKVATQCLSVSSSHTHSCVLLHCTGDRAGMRLTAGAEADALPAASRRQRCSGTTA
jgi:hypothetical protein